MGKNVEVEIPEEPKWETLREKLDCEVCKARSCSHSGYYGEKLDMLMDCPKKAAIFNLLFNYGSAIPIFFLFKKVFSLTSEKFFLSLLISLVILFFYDMIFVIIEKSIILFSTSLENRRKEKYQEEIQAIKEMKKKKKEEKEQEEEKEKLRFQEIENAFAIYQQFKKKQTSKAIKEKFSKPYDEMLIKLKELCDDLQIEHFSNPVVKNLFKIYLPELLDTIEKFVMQYEKELLSPKELAIFRKLLRTAKDKFAKVKQTMWQKETTSLYVDMMALDEALSTNNKEAK